MVLTGRNGRRFFPVVALVVFFMFTSHCLAALDVAYEDGRLTVRVSNQPLEVVLERISAVLDVDVYIADECRLEPLTINLEGVPVEAALGRILRAVSHAVLYTRTESGPRISTLKVYPKGSPGSPVSLVEKSGARGPADLAAVGQPEPSWVEAPESRSAAVHGARQPPGHAGVFVPERPSSTGAVSIASVRALEGLERERVLHEEIRALEVEASNAGDPDAKEAYTIALIEKIQEFHKVQKANRNAQAALRRLELFHVQRAGGAVQ